jgi:NTE family protein
MRRVLNEPLRGREQALPWARMPIRFRTALVLGGGAARGAYEAGVLLFLREEARRQFEIETPIDIISGTSVGAINACFLAASAHDPVTGARLLAESWRSLRLEQVLTFGTVDLMRAAREMFRRVPENAQRRTGGLVDPRGLQDFVRRQVRWRDIQRNVESGHVGALSITATHVATGRTTVFVQQAEDGASAWARNPHYRCVPARVGLRHAMASAAIPLLFPPVSLGGELYVDGGLRQNVPLSPALRLGAARVVVVSLRHRPESDALSPAGVEAPQFEPLEDIDPAELELRESALPSGPFLAGKALNALMLDRVDDDLARLRRLNAVLEAGTRSYGRSFEATLNQALEPMRSAPSRYIRNIHVHPSQDVGRFAAEYARSPEFARRAKGLAGKLVRRLADSEARDQADLASYLLFDGGFADLLIEMGRRDARQMVDEWRQFFSDLPETEAEAALLESPRAIGG